MVQPIGESGEFAASANSMEIGGAEHFQPDAWQSFIDKVMSSHGLEKIHQEGMDFVPGLRVALEQEVTGIIGTCGVECGASISIPGSLTGKAEDARVTVRCPEKVCPDVDSAFRRKDNCLLQYVRAYGALSDAVADSK